MLQEAVEKKAVDEEHLKDKLVASAVKSAKAISKGDASAGKNVVSERKKQVQEEVEKLKKELEGQTLKDPPALEPLCQNALIQVFLEANIADSRSDAIFSGKKGPRSANNLAKLLYKMSKDKKKFDKSKVSSMLAQLVLALIDGKGIKKGKATELGAAYTAILRENNFGIIL
jgi:hypothetical protein